MKYSVISIEDGFIVCENDEMKNEIISLNDINFDVYEGMIIFYDGINYYHNKEEECERKNKTIDILNKIRNRKK